MSANDSANLTPMFRQWEAAKAECPDALVLFRMGDFYELFGEDAEVASRILDLTLTARECGQRNKIPMCGVPFHSVDRYLGRLIDQGLKAAICEQIGDPKLAKGLVDRRITRVITKGTAIEDFLLEARANNYLAALYRDPADTRHLGVAWVDVSTGEFEACEIDGGLVEAVEELGRLCPSEVVLDESLAAEEGVSDGLARRLGARVIAANAGPHGRRARETLCRHFGVASLAGFGLEDAAAAREAAAIVLEYLRESKLDVANHLRAISLRAPGELMYLDTATRRNLELTQSIRGGGREGTLLALIDITLTPMGSRRLRQWLLAPLRAVEPIIARQGAVADIAQATAVRRHIRGALERVGDIERLMARVGTGSASARDLVALGRSLEQIPTVRAVLESLAAAKLAELSQALDAVPEVTSAISSALVDEPPVSLREGGLIRPGHCADLDELRGIATSGKDWIAALEAQERERTGIKSLRVGFNSVFGYYIEVSNANKDLVPEDYIRKQTLANAERYITPGLKEYESKVLGAEEKISALEYELFVALRQRVAEFAGRVLDTATALAEVDVLAALAEVAVRRNYVRPEVDGGDGIEIEGGRHPTVESLMPEGEFVPNDCRLDSLREQMAIVTGPNMAGKSTYLRQVALTVLLAQIGGFVPARRAKLGVVDRIFTRVGAHDDLAQGQSTFMVEMTETASILHSATRDSLIILDEIGRGTSTFDGLAIAWAVAEYIHNVVGAKTLFATHYHQLNALCESLPRVRNLRVLVKEEGERMTFLHRIAEGGTDRSYGVQVARLAGLPRAVIERAREVLWSLEQENSVGKLPAPKAAVPKLEFSMSQLSLFGPPEPDPRVELLRSVERIDVNGLTPLAALNFLADLRQKLIAAANDGSGEARG